MEEKFLKGSVAGISAVFAHFSDNFTPLIYVLVIFSALDYITGIVSALIHGGLSSKVAAKGFIRKTFYFVLVGVAFLFDFVIAESCAMLGWSFQWTNLLGILSVCYLISTEGISILENLTEWDINVPFLAPILKFFREKVISKGEVKPSDKNQES